MKFGRKAAAIPPGSDAFISNIFGGNCRICTILVNCPLSSYKFYVFPHLDAKLDANARCFNSNRNEGRTNGNWFRQLRQFEWIRCFFFLVWVEAPSGALCNPPPPPGNICTILGTFGRVHRWYMFCDAHQKFRANADLLRQSQQQNLNFYQGMTVTQYRFCIWCLHIFHSLFSLGRCSTEILPLNDRWAEAILVLNEAHRNVKWCGPWKI